MILMDFIKFVLVSKLRKIDGYLSIFWSQLNKLLLANAPREPEASRAPRIF